LTNGGGPATQNGKAVVRWNATRHGISSPKPVVPGLENTEDWENHLEGIMENLSPVGQLEITLAERVALLSWRLEASPRNPIRDRGYCHLSGDHRGRHPRPRPISLRHKAQAVLDSRGIRRLKGVPCPVNHRPRSNARPGVGERDSVVRPGA
jgi:hypothetical protein